jgi:hypothetical protein
MAQPVRFWKRSSAAIFPPLTEAKEVCGDDDEAEQVEDHAQGFP